MGSVYDRLSQRKDLGEFAAVSTQDFAELQREMPPQQRFMHRKLAGVGVENLMVQLTAVFPDSRLADGQVVVVDDICAYLGGKPNQWPERATFSGEVR